MKNRDGMASMMDAVMFVLIMGILVINYVIPMGSVDDDSAEDLNAVHTDLLGIRVSLRDFHPEMGDYILPLMELVIIEMQSGYDSNLDDFIQDNLEAMIGMPGGDCIIFQYKEMEWCLGDPSVVDSDRMIRSELNMMAPDGEGFRSLLYVRMA